MSRADLMAYLIRMDFEVEADCEKYRSYLFRHPEDADTAFMLARSLYLRKIVRKYLHDICAILDMEDH